MKTAVGVAATFVWITGDQANFATLKGTYAAVGVHDNMKINVVGALKVSDVEDTVPHLRISFRSHSHCG